MTSISHYSITNYNGVFHVDGPGLDDVIITAEHIQDAKEWMIDCEWSDMDEDDIADLSDGEVVRGVSRHFDGGWSAFLASY